ncbi:MAG TPA: 2-amino-4-hydroxy-6-hydroxymethyldihydropteridine diphosphokinase [Candidatus Syntrophosphaera sp.]|jgi:2-amino-4-hydroxy-6-hydroxymethyldihydropteridine diphosphokinase|nr:2-amino-4-hydroxy-6-hydroxymethyldihydropteridine diphosphokinase [Candidatus Syntrophosphaera sp.]HOH47844.1 2-amino-4-hydroxy-6-hydroxymethyldihydropteridine diphosphokinase [Candidatus Syntrophosphaera sp.]HPW38263.1 2-amino-4-hydroxy-6-hydroxymethyldihydropteridine diphosphokinase [Candidatus Syntrophosphaera sp.]HPX66620.1 2-amino-4-hydroxy-6-hydroxymethyldihydropteridine diphosphokinase [Candidatus Syntrophosphaera sp.]HQC46395.1 2-amino-4-hydroxy-6-hydroxymethyldihydropteridine diphos
MTAWLCLGSNQMKPRAQVQKAVRILAADPKIRVLRKSSLVRTKAYGKEDQPDFRNQVIEIDTKYSPLDLLQKGLVVETEMGRVRKERWGPRVIDIDILLYEDEEMQTMSLTLPHPDFHNRRFVLELLCEVDPELKHPVLNKTMAKLLEELGHAGGEQ